jgi:hypothetical protein
MSTTTPVDQQAREDLYTAMMLLEMHDTDMFIEPDAACALVVAAHAIIQNLAQRMQGNPATQLDMINQTLAAVWTRVALADATGSAAGVRDVSK